MKKTLIKLSNLGGISGFEETNSAIISELLEEFCDEIKVDKLGNFIGIMKSGKPNSKKLMLVAHTDGIGFVVSEILDKGFLRFSPIGGIDAKILPGCDVCVWGKKKIAGVIGAKPPHLLTAEESGKSVKMSEMVIDTGYSKEELLKIVSIGDMVTFNEDARELLSDTVSGKYLDDRAGIVSLLIAAKKIKEKNIDSDIYLLLSSQEEVGTRGAAVGSYEINPDAAIVVDVTHAKTPDSTEERSYKMGSGAAICVGPNIHPYMYDLAVKCAKKEDIPYEIEVEGGATGTDAEVVQIARDGVPCSLLSIPLKFMHTTVEVLSFSDVEAVGNLIAEMVADFSLEELRCSL